jgi:hypothetical protein
MQFKKAAFIIICGLYFLNNDLAADGSLVSDSSGTRFKSVVSRELAIHAAY